MASIRFDRENRRLSRLLPAFLLAIAANLISADSALAAGKITLSKVAWSARGGLTVRGAAKGIDAPLEIFDLNGRRLATGVSGKFNVTLSAQQLPSIPCGVRVQAGAIERQVAVTGAPRSCRKPVACSILEPAPNAALSVNAEVNFRARVVGKGPAYPLSYEWDFAGGAMEHPKGSLTESSEASAKTVFVRDNSNYRVRFIATDALGRRCEDAIQIAVGTPPTGMPGKVPERPAPKLGGELDGRADDLVVMPVEEWTMQHFTDMRVMPNGYFSFDPPISNLNTHVYRKARKPVLVTPDEVDVLYSAASNSSDPVGPDSINSTSQNWPLNAADLTQPAPLMTSTVQKSDLWERYNRPAGGSFWSSYVSEPLIFMYNESALWLAALPGLPRADEGFFPHGNAELAKNVDWAPVNTENTPEQNAQSQLDAYNGYLENIPKAKAVAPQAAEHGQFMPGINAPYAANDPQTFQRYDAGDGRFAINLLPISDTDDQGRINPYPLLRVEAVSKGGQSPLAQTDGVLSNSRDFHCRECHAKGQIAANPNAGHTQAAFHASPAGMADDEGAHAGHPVTRLNKPEFFAAASNSLFDQEYAAALNYASLHQFYDGMGFLDLMQKGWIVESTGLIVNDYPPACYGCHLSPLLNTTNGMDWWFAEERDTTHKSYDPNYSIAMHRFHAEMQYNADKSDIIRDEKGMYKRFDWKAVTARTPGKDINPNTLFPIFGPDGKQLPMEQNCLRCHAGHREPLYRDRMFTAGVSCFDCHGDMFAVGQAFSKDAAKLGSSNRADYRIPWYDETDCGSCHTGNGNIGRDASGGFFSAGVRKTAFDENDLSAKTRAVDKTNSDASRFAVVPNYSHEFVTSQTIGDNTDNTPTKIDLPVYRKGKDTHGNVPCASCHGGAHAIWPNRDPSANDNVTALQLQGHTGNILECNVCHTADAFKNEADLDGGQYSGDPVAGILGGPHNLHPINDPYWWKSTEGDSPNADGTTYGGWHNNYAKKPDKNGKDQCAACHGDDHKGSRLSKTPVDREFSFRGMNAAKLKKAGLKSRVVKVTAGTPIGCDTCHRLELSFSGIPGR